MALISSHRSRYIPYRDFRRYLQETGNTICGQNPIILLISLIEKCGTALNTSFVKYAQSERVSSPDDMSVSYAAAVTLKPL